MIGFSEIQSIYFILPFIGLIIGLLGTILGGGGGFFFLPILILVLRVPVQTAVITSLVATLPICLVGSLGHYRKNNIDFNVGLILILGGVIGAFVGAKISGLISGHHLKMAFGIYSVLIASNMILNARKKRPTEDEIAKLHDDPKSRRIVNGSVFGLIAGLITGTFGTSGTAPVFAGLFSLKIPFKIVVGTSLMVVSANTIFAISAHFFVGKTDFTLVSFLTAGSAVGAVLGPKLLSRIKLEKAESSAVYWYATIMIVIGILMIVGRN